MGIHNNAKKKKKMQQQEVLDSSTCKRKFSLQQCLEENKTSAGVLKWAAAWRYFFC